MQLLLALLCLFLATAESFVDLRGNSGNLDKTSRRSDGEVIYLPSVLSRGTVGEKIKFGILDGKHTVGTVTKITSVNGGFVWSGKVHDGTFFLSYSSGVMMCNIMFPGEDSQYEIRPLDVKSSSYILKKVAMSKYDVEPAGEVHEALEIQAKEEKVHRATTEKRKLQTVDTNNIIDVMILYTPEALAMYGGENRSMHALAELGVIMSNDAFERSNVDLRMRAVHISEIYDKYYVEQGMSVDLGRMLSQTDGYFDADTAKRDVYGADATVMIVADTAYCGLGYLGYGALYAWSTISVLCPQSMSHEVGHNIGLHHDRLTVTGETAPPPNDIYYNYGYCWDTSPTTCSRSVMAYSGCVTPMGQSGCPRDLFFSTPLVRNGGERQPVGTVYSDNSRILTEQTSSAINWRHSITGAGLIFAATPAYVSRDSCSIVTINGWNIGTGSDISMVTLAGVPVAQIISQSAHHVEVLTGLDTVSSTDGVISVSTTSGITTELVGAFFYESANGQFVTDFNDGSSLNWNSVGSLEWRYMRYCSNPPCTSNAPYSGPTVGVGNSDFASVTAPVLGNGTGILESLFNGDTTNCVDTVSSISFSYHLYTPYSQCRGDFSVWYKDSSGTWMSLSSSTSWGGQTGQDDGWYSSSFAIPDNGVVTGLRFVANPYPIVGDPACRYYGTVALDDIIVDKSTTCTNNNCMHYTASPSAVSTPHPSARPTTVNQHPSQHPSHAPSPAPTQSPGSNTFSSNHPYSNSESLLHFVSFPGASSLSVVFSEETSTEYYYDVIKITADSYWYTSHQYGNWSGSAGRYPGQGSIPALVVEADELFIMFQSDGSVTAYGYDVTVTPNYGGGLEAWTYMHTSSNCAGTTASPCGPEYWGKVAPQCDEKEQSPMDVHGAKFDADAKLPVYKEKDIKDWKQNVTNQGFTVHFEGKQPSMDYRGKQFKLLNLTVHSPSENTVNGRHYPAEVQMVHYNSKKGFTIVSVMLDTPAVMPFSMAYQLNNTLLNTVWAADGRKGNDKNKNKIDPYASFIPADSKFYVFDGSFTAPPCASGVKWLVYADAMTISDFDLATIRESHMHIGDSYGNNFRPVMPRDDRKIDIGF